MNRVEQALLAAIGEGYRIVTTDQKFFDLLFFDEDKVVLIRSTYKTTDPLLIELLLSSKCRKTDQN